METPEEFVAREDVLVRVAGGGRIVDADAIAARDNAVRLALLEEISQLASASRDEVIVTHGRYFDPEPFFERAVTALRLKYTPPRGKL